MPYEVVVPKPHTYELKLRNDAGQNTTIKTNLHYMAYIQNDLVRGFSPLVFFCGRQRIGKSKTALYFQLMNAVVWGKKFNLRASTFYEPMAAVASIEGSDINHESRSMDECVELDRQEWYEQTHRALAKIIISQGIKNLLWQLTS